MQSNCITHKQSNCKTMQKLPCEGVYYLTTIRALSHMLNMHTSLQHYTSST